MECWQAWRKPLSAAYVASFCCHLCPCKPNRKRVKKRETRNTRRDCCVSQSFSGQRFPAFRLPASGRLLQPDTRDETPATRHQTSWRSIAALLAPSRPDAPKSRAAHCYALAAETSYLVFACRFRGSLWTSLCSYDTVLVWQ